MGSKQKIRLSRYALAAIAVWGVCTVLWVAGYYLFYLPQQTEQIRIQQQFSESAEQLENARLAALRKTKEQMQQRYEQTSRTIADFSTASDSVTGLVFQIGQIANDLRLTEFSSKNQKNQYASTVGDSKRLAESWLTVEFFATFEQLAHFVNQMERNCPFVFVEKVFFRRGAAGSKGHEAKLELSFLASTETVGDPVAMADGDSAADAIRN
ncbi:MAG: hypothetical protein L0Y36_04040 [Planctomycetales bacterium]|nr:hypothetical protein [Planctomycetales bacterium]